MNKLVSKDPILKFKLGRKIVKAQNGQILYLTGDDGKDYEYWRGGSDWYYRPKGGTGMTRVDYTNKRFYNSTNKGAVARSFDEANNYYNPQKKVIKYGLSSDNSWYESGTENDGRVNYSKGITPEKIVPQKDGRIIAKINGKWYNQKGELVTNFVSHDTPTKETTTEQNPKPVTVTKTSVRTTPYNSRTAELLLKLYDAGFLKLEGNMRNGKWDGIWGKNTEAAYLEYMNRDKNLSTRMDEVIYIPVQNILPTNVTGYSSPEVKLLFDNVKLKSQVNYNPSFNYRDALNLSFYRKLGGQLVSKIRLVRQPSL